MEHLDMLRIGLLPQPIAPENIRVTSNRLERRRKATGVSVVAVERDEPELITTGAASITEVLALRSPYPKVPCGASSGLMPYGDLSSVAGDLQSFRIRWRGRRAVELPARRDLRGRVPAKAVGRSGRTRTGSWSRAGPCAHSASDSGRCPVRRATRDV